MKRYHLFLIMGVIMCIIPTKDYFLAKEYTKKYKENIITTYEYLLLINKL